MPPEYSVVAFIVVHIGVGRILDFDARHVLPGDVVPHHDIARLPDIDAGIGRADGFAILYQKVGGLHWVQARKGRYGRMARRSSGRARRG